MADKKKTKDQKKTRKPSKIAKVPTDEPSFQAFIRARTKEISQLSGHLAQIGNHRDSQGRRLLERLIDERGFALQGPPETISPACVQALREEISNG